jgi:hydroxyethylthiazole kinase-like uncharacterized protein yjeF
MDAPVTTSLTSSVMVDAHSTTSLSSSPPKNPITSLSELPMTTLSANSAAALDADLMSGEAPLFKLEQLIELAGLAVAQATHKSSSSNGSPPLRILLVCGPGNNGGDGLVAARHLLAFGHQVTVLSIRKRTNVSFFDNLERQVEFFGGKLVIDTWPDDWTPEFLTSSFDVCIDSIFGFSFKGEVRSPWDRIIDTLAKAKAHTKPTEKLSVDGSFYSIPFKMISVDVPSGWSVDRSINVDDESSIGKLLPDVLVSLTAPKEVALRFEREALKKKNIFQHWLGGRFVPLSVMKKYGVEHLLQLYKEDDQVVRLR